MPRCKRKPLRQKSSQKRNSISKNTNGINKIASASKISADDLKITDDEHKDGEENEILMEGKVEDEYIPITFEFNDMREKYLDGIRSLLRNLIKPDDSFEVSNLISGQGKSSICR